MAGGAAYGGRQRTQGEREDVGEDEIVWSAIAQSGMLKAGRRHRAHPWRDAVENGVGARGLNRNGVDVARDHRLAQRLCGGDGQHAGAGANVQNGIGAAALEDIIEHQQAAARGAVVAGSKGERSLNLQRNVVLAHGVTVMGAMHQKAPGAHGGQPMQRGGDPVLLGHAREGHGGGGLKASHHAHQFAHIGLVRRGAEIGLHQPFARGPIIGLRFALKRRGRSFCGIEHFDNEISNGARLAFRAGERHHVGGVVGGQTFEHQRALAYFAAGDSRGCA